MTLAAFDFDGTLSDSEMTVLLGEQYDALEQRTTSDHVPHDSVADEMERITERAMNDEINYAESLRERCALLEGLPQEEAEDAFDQVVLREDAARVIEALNEAGVHTAVLTGGFQRGVERALEKAGVAVDSIVANRLPVADDREAGSAPEAVSGQRPRVLTGEVEGPLVEGTKDDALGDLAEAVGVDMDETVAVGDGANDLPMLEVAGFSVGFDPKPAVEPACDAMVHSMADLKRLFEEEGVLG